MKQKNIVRLFGILILLVFLSACSENGHEATNQPVSRKPPQIPNGDPERGKDLLQEYGCISCHIIPGIAAADGNTGPPLTNWADRQYIAGALPNTPENLIHWIRFPQAVEPGTVMPNLDVAEDEARHMAAYLYTLTDEGQLTDVFSTPRAAIGGLVPGGEKSGEQQGEVPNTGQQENQDGEGQQRIQKGEQVFSSNCAKCHGQNGEGQVGPALAGNSFVTSQDPAPVIQTILHGRGQMPAFNSQLSDEQVAAAASYIRNSWGNSASIVSPDQVAGSQGGSQQAGQPGGGQGESGQQQAQQTPAPGGEGDQQAQPEQSGQANQQTATPDQGASEPSAQEQGPVNPGPTASVVMIEIYEWGIDISRSTLPGDRVVFHVTNVGTRPHRFTIEGQGMELAFPSDIPAGETRTLLVNLRPGQYRIFSPVEDYAQRGISLEFSAAEPEQPALPRDQQETPTPAGSPDATPAPGSEQGQGQQQSPTPAADTPPQQDGQSGQQGQPGGEQLAQQGEQVFGNNCAQCHGQNGEGQVGPALAGNEFVTSQDPSKVIETVLNGRGQMPAFEDQLSNEQIAAVVTFIRSSWGNNASPISPEQVGGGENQQGGQNGQQGDQQAQPGPQQQVTIDLAARNRSFDKNSLSVPAGAKVTLNLTNHDSVPHNFAVYQDSSVSKAIFVGEVFSGPDRTVTYEFTAPAKSGSYFFRCDVHPFMNGELIVH